MSGRVTPPSPGAPADRVPVSHGTMGPTHRATAITQDESAGHDGRRQIFAATRPDLVRHLRHPSAEAGADSVKTNTFGADVADQAERGTAGKIFEPSRRGAEAARGVADESRSTPRGRLPRTGEGHPGAHRPEAKWFA